MRPHLLTRKDILSLEAYEKIRPQKRVEVLSLKKKRRLLMEPFATFHFENWDTLWWQIHEMLRIEKGGETQIADELAAYAPLVPRGSELVATLMFEIEDPVERAKTLGKMGHVEHMIFFRFGDHKIQAIPTDETERTNKTGKTSAVHFLKFPFTTDQKQDFLSSDAFLEISHPAYSSSVLIPEALISTLQADFLK